MVDHWMDASLPCWPGQGRGRKQPAVWGKAGYG